MQLVEKAGLTCQRTKDYLNTREPTSPNASLNTLITICPAAMRTGIVTPTSGTGSMQLPYPSTPNHDIQGNGSGGPSIPSSVEVSVQAANPPAQTKRAPKLDLSPKDVVRKHATSVATTAAANSASLGHAIGSRQGRGTGVGTVGITVLAANISSVATASHLSSKPRATLKNKDLKEVVKQFPTVDPPPPFLLICLAPFSPLGGSLHVSPVVPSQPSTTLEH